MKKNVMRIVLGGILVLIALGVKYATCFALTPRSEGFWLFLFIVAAISTVLFSLFENIIEGGDFKTTFGEYAGTFITGGAAAVLLLGIIVMSCFGMKITNTPEYQELIKIEEGDFAEDIVPVDNVDNITVVDMETAEKLGDRTTGDMKNATWYEVDNEYNVIIYKDQQYRISPLNYGGLFKYQKAKYFGIPGYVLVNSITQEAQFVELENPITVSPSAYFSNNLKRTLRRQYSDYIFGTSYFEIDEAGAPYWITAVLTPSMGVWKAKLVTSVIVTDASTGESIEYKLNEIPEWIDHVYSLEYLMTLVDYNYKYVNGYWNLGKTGVNKTTYSYRSNNFSGYNTAITQKDEVVYYTGVTPYNSAETNLGFLLASPRTGIVKYYKCAGAEESSAQAAAQGLVQNLGYIATFPTIINVDGVETYFMALKDNAGLVQKYSLCQVKNYTNVVEAQTLDETLQKYRSKIGIVVDDEPIIAEKQTLSGVITELYSVQINGYTNFCFTLEGSTLLYVSTIMNNIEQVKLKIGSQVNIEYCKTDEELVFTVTKITF